VVEPVKGKPILILTWIGQDPTLPGLLLNAHTDVFCFVLLYYITNIYIDIYYFLYKIIQNKR